MRKSFKIASVAAGLMLAFASHAQTTQSWMSSDVGAAWAQGYKGQGVTVTVIDDFNSTAYLQGNLGLGASSKLHGQWTAQESGMVAPSATIRQLSYGSPNSLTLAKGLNVVNMSYGMMAQDGYTSILWDKLHTSIVNLSKNNQAVFAKAAGNDAVAVGVANSAGNKDYLNTALIGNKSTIFVGALDRNGTTAAPANLAWYSNYAGTNTAVQDNFLVVGVEGSKTGLYGTSFAAPIVSGYAAILGSKFKTASPSAVTNQLLATARTDTIANYNRAVHGRGEASLSRALAPTSIK